MFTNTCLAFSQILKTILLSGLHLLLLRVWLCLSVHHSDGPSLGECEVRPD